MYHIESNNAVVGDYEVVIWIRLHQNGSFTPCSQDVAEGVCVKIPHRARVAVLDENGEPTGEETFVTSYTDTVFRIKEDGLTGEEPMCTVTEVEEFTTLAEQKAAAYDVLMGVAQ